MNDVLAIRDVSPDDTRFMERPRHRGLFIFGVSVLGLWFPISFGGLVNFLESTSPIVTVLVPREDVALTVLLLWGLPGIPAVLLGYYGGHRSNVI